MKIRGDTPGTEQVIAGFKNGGHFIVPTHRAQKGERFKPKTPSRTSQGMNEVGLVRKQEEDKEKEKLEIEEKLRDIEMKLFSFRDRLKKCRERVEEGEIEFKEQVTAGKKVIERLEKGKRKLLEELEEIKNQ